MGNRGSKVSARERKTAEMELNDRLNTFNSRALADTDRLKRLAFASRSANNTEFNINLERIARIVNGIYLQKVLIDSDVSEEALAEILHMGPMAPEYLLALEEKVVEEIMAAMKKTSAQFVKNTDAIRIENRYLNMNLAMSSDFKADEFETLKDKQDYKTHLGTLKTTSPSLSDLTEYKKSVTDAYAAFEKFPGLKSDGASNTALAESIQLSSFTLYLSKMEKRLENLQNVVPFLSQLKQLKEKSSFIQLLIEESKLRGYQEVHTVDVSADDQSKANFDLFAEIGSKLAQYADELTKLTGLADSLKSVRQADAKYTAGLPNGVSDLGKLPADVEDKEFQKSGNITQETSSILRKALLPLESLQANLEKVEEAWKPALGKISSALPLITQHLIMANQSKHAPARTEGLKEMRACHEDSPKVGTGVAWTETYVKAINRLNMQVDKLNTSDPAQQLAPLDVIKKAMNYNGTERAYTPTETPAIVKKLNAMPEVAQFLQTLKELEKQAVSLEAIVKDFSGNVKAIEDELSNIDSYHQQVVNFSFKKWHKCLKEKVKDNGALVAEMLNAMKVIRSLAASGVDDTEGFTKTMMDSKSLLRSSQDDAKAMKGVKEPEPLSLKMFEQAEEATRNIGRASEGLLEMRKVAENRQKLGPLMGDFSFIAKALENKKKSLQPEDVAGLEELLSLPQSLKDTFADFDQFKLSVDKLVLVNFDSIKLVFGDAAKIRSVKQDAKKMKKALEALLKTDPSLKPQLDPIIAALDTLEPLALDFSSYKWNEAAVGMDYFYEFLRNYPSAVVAASAASVGPLVKGSTSSSEDNNTLLIIGVCAAVAAAMGVSIGIFAWKKCSKEEVEEEPGLKGFNNERARALAFTLSGLLKMSNKFVDDIYAIALNNGFCMWNGTVQVWNSADPHAPIVENFPRDMLRYSTRKVVRRNVVMVGDKYLNGNWITFMDFPGKRKYYCLQAPKCGREGKIQKRKKELSNRAKAKVERNIALYYKLLSREKIRLVVILRADSDTECECANFFPSPTPFVGKYDDSRSKEEAKKKTTMTFGEYEVRLVRKVSDEDIKRRFAVNPDDYDMYEIEYKRGTNVESVYILIANIWTADNKPPTSAKPALELLRLIRNYEETNVAIMCPTGVDRSATLLGVRKYMEMSADMVASGDPKIFVRSMRLFCRGALLSPSNLWYAIMAGTKGAIDDSRTQEFTDAYPKLLYAYGGIRSGKYTTVSILSDAVRADTEARDTYVRNMHKRWKKAHPEWAADQSYKLTLKEHQEAQERWFRDGQRERNHVDNNPLVPYVPPPPVPAHPPRIQRARSADAPVILEPRGRRSRRT